MPALASLPAVNQEPAPGWAMVSLPSRPKQPVVAQAPKPVAMAKVTLPARPRAPQLAAAPHVGSTLARPLAATYHVKAGDTLSEIALRELGSSTLWHVVYDANRDQLTNPRWLEVGLTLKIPRGNDAGGQVYVVKQGDSLSKIARVMLGDMKKWRELYAANKQQIRDPWFIFPGQRLVLPGTQNLAHHQVDQRWATLKATVYPPA
jgi:nucleoid-associated protein YgaU